MEKKVIKEPKIRAIFVFVIDDEIKDIIMMKCFLSIFLEFRFYGYGCCYFDSIIRTVYKEGPPGSEEEIVKWSLQECKKICINDPQCIAIDIAKDSINTPNDGKFKCYIFIHLTIQTKIYSNENVTS